MWIEEVIASYADGRTPSPPPAITQSPRGASWVPPKVVYESNSIYPEAYMSVFSAHPNRLSPNQHYVQGEAAYHVYGYETYPGDITPEQVQLPPAPPYIE